MVAMAWMHKVMLIYRMPLRLSSRPWPPIVDCDLSPTSDADWGSLPTTFYVIERRADRPIYETLLSDLGSGGFCLPRADPLGVGLIADPRA